MRRKEELGVDIAEQAARNLNSKTDWRWKSDGVVVSTIVSLPASRDLPEDFINFFNEKLHQTGVMHQLSSCNYAINKDNPDMVDFVLTFKHPRTISKLAAGEFEASSIPITLDIANAALEFLKNKLPGGEWKVVEEEKGFTIQNLSYRIDGGTYQEGGRAFSSLVESTLGKIDIDILPSLRFMPPGKVNIIATCRSPEDILFLAEQSGKLQSDREDAPKSKTSKLLAKLSARNLFSRKSKKSEAPSQPTGFGEVPKTPEQIALLKQELESKQKRLVILERAKERTESDALEAKPEEKEKVALRLKQLEEGVEKVRAAIENMAKEVEKSSSSKTEDRPSRKF